MPELDWTHANLAEAYRDFRARMELFLDDQAITAASKQAIKIKIAIGDEGMRRLLSSSLTLRKRIRENYGHFSRHLFMLQQK